MSYHTRCLTAFLLVATSSACSSAQDSFAEPIGFDFSGTLQDIDLTLTNPYTGTVIRVAGQKNVNNTTYVGGANFDSISFTALGDAIFIREGDEQVVTDVEIMFLGPGGDIAIFSDETFVLPELTILGNTGNDVIWGNVGGDVILGEAGNDHLIGGPGNDRLRGGDNDDFLHGGTGADSLDGGAGFDDLFGGEGPDTYIAGLGIDLIIEDDSPDRNVIHLQVGLTIDDLTFIDGRENTDPEFDFLNQSLIIEYAGMGAVVIVDHFATPNSGIDAIILDNGEGEVFDLRAFFVPEPSTFVLIVGLLGLASVRRRSN